MDVIQIFISRLAVYIECEPVDRTILFVIYEDFLNIHFNLIIMGIQWLMDIVFS